MFTDTIEVHLENDDVKSEIKASSSWGILRGLESFSQMVKLGDKSVSIIAVGNSNNKTTINFRYFC